MKETKRAGGEDMTDIRDDVTRFYETYITAWNARAFEDIADCYAEPSVFVLPQHTATLPDRSATVALMRQVFAELEASGFSHSEIGPTEVRTCGEGLAILDVQNVRRMHQDGSVLETIDAHYVVKRIDGKWQFAVTVVCDPGWRTG